jgi:hypothetical protein
VIVPVIFVCRNAHPISHSRAAARLGKMGAPHHRQHTTYARGEIPLHVQLGAEGKLPVMTMRAQEARTHLFHEAHRGEDRSPTQFLIARPVTAGASQTQLVRNGKIAVQQLTQGYSPGLMHGPPYGHFYGFQIDPAILALVLPDRPQQTTYFARDFLLDGFGFFFCNVDAGSSGRNSQILSLTAISF